MSTQLTQNVSLAQVGQRLFFDVRLSADGRISCAQCHDPKKGFADGLTVARGVDNLPGTRNTPSLWNVAYSDGLFWDGRRTTLEEQAADPLVNPREHGLRDLRALTDLIRSDDRYADELARAFGIARETVAPQHVFKALAAFERTLVSGNSPFDRYLYAQERSAVSPSAARGLQLFRGRAQCAGCHLIGEHSALLMDDQFHAIGIGLQSTGLGPLAVRVANASAAELDALIGESAAIASLGRFVVTKDPRDIGKFKTPSLRNVALTAPYMHDGSIKTLEAAVDSELSYRSAEKQDPLILTPAEKADLVAFLNALTSPDALDFR